MSVFLASNWLTIALRGACGIVFGIVAFARPGAAITAIILVFGAYAILDGIFALIAAARGGTGQRRWGTLLVEGIVGILVGLAAFVAPGLTAVALVALIAAWALITGFLEIAAAIRLRKTIRHEWLLALSGVLSIVFGLALWMAPVMGAIVLAWWIGAYLFVAGIVQLVLAFRLRSWGKLAQKGPEALAA